MPVCDVVLVCIKTTANHLLPELIKPLLHPESVVVLLQNGLGLEEELTTQLKDIQIAGGLAFICSAKVGPGHIHHLDFGKLIIGSHNVKKISILEQIVGDFQSVGVHTELAADLGLPAGKNWFGTFPLTE